MIVTLLTDFGLSDHYAAAMKGVILRTDPRITIVDITHEVPAHDVSAAAFLLASCCRDFPAGAVHVAVVDPGVGSRRRPVVVEAGGYFFVGPDNGVLADAVRDAGSHRVHEIEPAAVTAGKVSTTFHGRDIFAPAAALLATGVPLETLGPPIDELIESGPAPVLIGDNGVLTGRILHVDRFGNCVTSLTPADFSGSDWRRWRFRLAGRDVEETREFYSQNGESGAFVILGSTGRLEVSMDRRSAAGELSVRAGETISAWPPAES